MPRYRFGLIDAAGRAVYECSETAADFEEALFLARWLARSLALYRPVEENWSGWSVEMADDSGSPLLDIPVPTGDGVAA